MEQAKIIDTFGTYQSRTFLGSSPKEPRTKLAKEANAITRQKSGKTKQSVKIDLPEALL